MMKAGQAMRARTRRTGAALVITAVVLAASALMSGPDAVAAPTRAAPPSSATHAPPPQEVSYGPDPLQTIAVYPAATTGAPLVVMIPGDGWRSSINMNMQVATAKALQAAGFAVFDTNYRGDSSTTPAFPMEIDDIVAATDYAITHAVQYSANPARVTLLGGSAGGQLAAFSTEVMNAAVPHKVSTVVTLSGPFDFPSAIAYWAGQTGPTAALHLGNQLTALGCRGVTRCPIALQNQWSTDQHVTAANCPTRWLLMNGSAEEMPVQQADAMTTAARAAGCNVTETIIPTNQHGFHYYAAQKATINAFIAAG